MDRKKRTAQDRRSRNFTGRIAFTAGPGAALHSLCWFRGPGLLRRESRFFDRGESRESEIWQVGATFGLQGVLRKTMFTRKAKLEGGHAIVEVALMSPWIFLLFIGVFDFGFYAYGAICTQNAARVAALKLSASQSTAGSQATACTYVLQEMSMMPNMAGVTSCSAAPLTVTVTTYVAGTAAACVEFQECESRVVVQYQTIPLLPIPGFYLAPTIQRTVRVYANVE
jgi:Flp pilus assembly protein TadG